MGVLLKCLLGVFAIFCLMQFVKMDDDTTPPERKFDFKKGFRDMLKKFPTPSPERVGKFAENLAKTFQGALKDNN